MNKKEFENLIKNHDIKKQESDLKRAQSNFLKAHKLKKSDKFKTVLKK